ncbi:hypothetical protein [Formosa haliotis]|uniref:hypothetical protein n=1 Tax=Formosa haliotis TaxID=1555194 RepID=UPI000826F0E1|nr:hypothetical protein [Formosa haliotis]
MKKLIKFSGGMLFCLIYCFALYSASQPIPETFELNSKHSESQQKISSVSKSLITLTSESETFSFSFNPSSGQFLKIPFQNSGWISNYKEPYVLAQISQYSKYQTNTLVNHRKNDAIFPFHYFW